MKKNIRWALLAFFWSAAVAGAVAALVFGQTDKKSAPLEATNPDLVYRFMSAVESGDLNTVKAMLETTPGLLQVKYWSGGGGNTPLQEAAAHNRKEIVEFFLSRGADINGLNQGWTPLLCTVHERDDRSDMVDFLLKHGAQINAAYPETGMTALIMAAGWANVATVRLLLDRGASVNAATKKGQTALHWACEAARPEIVELLLSRGASTSALDDQKHTPLAAAQEKLRQSPGQASYQRVIDILTGQAPKPAGNRFSYIGRAEVDDRKAELDFMIDGAAVTGQMIIHAVQSANARLAGADLEFKAGIEGLWEDAKTQLQGSWSGVDHFGPDQANDGEITISLLKPGNLYAEEVYVKLVGRRGRYGWCFPACGRVYDSGVSSYIQIIAPNPLVGATGPWAACVEDNPMRKWETMSAQLSGPYSLSPLEKCCFDGLIYLLVDSKRLLIMGARRSEVDPATGTVKPSPDKLISEGALSCYCEPADVLRASVTAASAVTVEGVSKGIGKVILYRVDETETPQGVRQSVRVQQVFVVEVQEKEGPAPSAPTDISRVDICGRALMKDGHAPVRDARVTLVIASGPFKGKSYPLENILTDKEGRFGATGRNLATGSYEVLVQKLGIKGMAIEDDLWPVKKYIFKLSRDLSKEGVLDVGTIEMDRVGEQIKYERGGLDFGNRPEQAVTPTFGKSVVNQPRK
jgi:hypothetical protein